MKVYVVTKSPIFGKEEYVTVKASRKEAEKYMRAEWPHMRKDSARDNIYIADAKNDLLLYIHEELI